MNAMLRAGTGADGQEMQPDRVEGESVLQRSRVRIERGVLKDLDGMVQLERACFKPELAFARRRFRHLLTQPTADVWVCWDELRLVADAIVLRRRTARGVLGRIYSLVVAPDQRGRGYGRALLRHCLGELEGQGARAVVLEVAPDNAAAMRLYEQEGFRRVGIIADYYAPRQPACKMRLDWAQRR